MSHDASAFNCTTQPKITSDGVFEGDMPFDFMATQLAFQMSIFSLMSMTMQVLFRPLGQDRYVADLTGGFVLGPSVLGRIAPDVFNSYVHTPSGFLIRHALHSIGLVYWYFLMGLQINIGPMMKHMERKSIVVGLASLTSPVVLAYAGSYLINSMVRPEMQCHVSPFFLGMGFTTTTLTVLAGNVIQRKLLHADFAKFALNAAIFTKVVMMIPLIVMLMVLPSKGKPYMPHWKVLSGVAYFVFVLVFVRPVIDWVIQQTPNEDDVKDCHVCGALFWAIASASITDSLGSHTPYGAFLAGVIIPHSAFSTTIVKKLEDFNTLMLLPLFFAAVGFATDLERMFDGPKGWTMLLLLMFVYGGKVCVLAILSTFYNINFNEGVLVGLLMSSRGILDILLLFWSTLSKLNGADPQEYAIMMFCILLTNMMIGPALSSLYKPPRVLHHMSCRAIEQLGSISEFRILCCIHDQHAVPSILSLVKVSNPTKMSPIHLSVLHLLHATYRESAMVDHSLQTTTGFTNEEEQNWVATAFKMHKWDSWVCFELMTKLSSYSTMHEHVCTTAESDRSTVVIIPFYVRKSAGAQAGVSSATVRSINLNVLEEAECSVGILVDLSITESSTYVYKNVIVLFFGGADDREALAYATRMARGESINLTVVRFLPVGDAISKAPHTSNDLREDDVCIDRFKSKVEGNHSVVYMERLVESGADTVSELRELDEAHDVFIVGRRHGASISSMMSGLEAWSEYEELGLVGDMLVSSDFNVQAVLVMQQYVWYEEYEDDRVEMGAQPYRYFQHQPSMADSPQDRPMANRGRKNVVQFDDYGWNWNLNAGF